jgi:hypothetical protein
VLERGSSVPLDQFSLTSIGHVLWWTQEAKGTSTVIELEVCVQDPSKALKRGLLMTHEGDPTSSDSSELLPWRGSKTRCLKAKSATDGR